MPRRDLLRQLSSLQQQLAEIDDAQPEVRRKLRALQQEIHRIESRQAALVEAGDVEGPAPPTDDDEDERLLDRLEEYAAEFEAEHPTLAATARDLVRRLASIGI
ncbi:MAG: DUF4404 family protein [Acidobacteria bacterium]|nr:MAG: DUF4404 family protein [Acidobacteriota bacterium]REK04395.1 MAG: DUF4404 family protein [Acidobacteriota bacterium]